MKKKLTGLLLCLIMSFAFILTGCDLFPRNMEQYLNKPVCTITYTDGTKDQITTEAFINAFNSYGYNLTQNGSSYEESADKTLDILISRYVLLNHAKKVVTIDDADEMELLDEVYTSLNSSLDSYISAVRTEWNIPAPTTAGAETEDIVKYTPYEKTAEVVKVDGEYKIELIEAKASTQSTHFTSIDEVAKAFKTQSNPTDTTSNSKVKKEAYRRFVTALKKNEEGLNLSTDYDSILKRYAKKLYTSSEENFYITSLEDYFKKDNKYSTISVKQVLNKYKTLMLQSKFKYEADSTAYNKAMLESFTDVNYVIDSNYFFVSHILIKFNEEEQAEYDSLKNDAYITEYVRNQKIIELTNQLSAKVRDEDGKIVENTNIKAVDVLADLQEDLAYFDEELNDLYTERTTLENSAETEANTERLAEVNNLIQNIYNQKSEIFRNYMYTYSEDTGTQNAEYMYVIGTEDSKMVESFTEASRELHEKGEFGQITALIPSEYGVHIVFYGGVVENVFNISDEETFALEESDIEKLVNTKLSALNNKTLFDKVFAMLSNDSYSIFENMELNVLMKGLKIEKHKDVYQNL